MSSTILGYYQHMYLMPKNQEQYSNYRNNNLANDLEKFLINDYKDIILSSNSPNERIYAAKKLGEWGSVEEIPLLTDVSFSDNNPNVRIAVNRAINRIRSRI